MISFTLEVCKTEWLASRMRRLGGVAGRSQIYYSVRDRPASLFLSHCFAPFFSKLPLWPDFCFSKTATSSPLVQVWALSLTFPLALYCGASFGVHVGDARFWGIEVFGVGFGAVLVTMKQSIPPKTHVCTI